MYDTTYKVIMLGDKGVGKKTLCKIHLSNIFKRETQMKLGFDFDVKKLYINDKKIKLHIWNIGPHERFGFLLAFHVRGANGMLIMYDVTNRSSLTIIDDWIPLIRKEIKSEQDAFPIVLVGNKAECEEIREVSGNEGIEFAKSRGMDGFIECSVKTGENVEEIFNSLTRLMMQRSNLF